MAGGGASAGPGVGRPHRIRRRRAGRQLHLPHRQRRCRRKQRQCGPGGNPGRHHHHRRRGLRLRRCLLPQRRRRPRHDRLLHIRHHVRADRPLGADDLRRHGQSGSRLRRRTGRRAAPGGDRLGRTQRPRQQGAGRVLPRIPGDRVREGKRRRSGHRSLPDGLGAATGNDRDAARHAVVALLAGRRRRERQADDPAGRLRRRRHRVMDAADPGPAGAALRLVERPRQRSAPGLRVGRLLQGDG